MISKFRFMVFFFITCFTINFSSGHEIDCGKPPQLSNPVECCVQAGDDIVVENCYKRILANAENKFSSEKIACFSRCVLTDAGYLQEGSEAENLDFDKIGQDLQNRFSNDTQFVNTMVAAYASCLPKATDRMQAFRQLPMSADILKKSCSPFSSILLSCTFIEYFKSCPTHLWNDVEPCQITRDFFKKCT